ncbi:MAG: hypothetical protein Q7S92_03100 [Candidatus Diapherotrites archaeon]|nr:hypothetical protein [Candidatus Diapherotrites archaeon]
MNEKLVLGLIGILVLFGCTAGTEAGRTGTQIESFENGWSEIQAIEDQQMINLSTFVNTDPELDLPWILDQTKLEQVKTQIANIQTRTQDLSLRQLTKLYLAALNAVQTGMDAEPALRVLVNLDTVNPLEVCASSVENSIGKVKEYLNELIALTEKRNEFTESFPEQASTAGILKFEGSIEETQAGITAMDSVSQELKQACNWN